jgi:hypothetical protein
LFFLFPGSGFHLRNRQDQDIDEEIDIDGDDGFGEAQFTEGDVLGLSTRGGSVLSPLTSEDDDGEEDEEEGDNPRSTIRQLLAGTETQQPTTNASSTSRNGNTMPNQEDDARLLARMIENNRIEQLIRSARRSADKSALISALEAKVAYMVCNSPACLKDILLSLTPKLSQESYSPTASSGGAILCRICLDPYTEPTTSTGCWHTCCRECWLRCLGVTKLCPICQRITGAHELRRVYL